MANFDHLNALLNDFVKTGPAGCSCAVAKEGKILYEGYFGQADAETGRPITDDSVFRLFSMTKVIVCTAAMLLFERGKFLLDDPLEEYLPEYREAKVFVTRPNGTVVVEPTKHPILVKHAFSMAIGLPYPVLDMPTAHEMAKVKTRLSEEHGKYDLLTEVRAMGSVPLAFEPGSHWLYGYGHDVVAALIQIISGKRVGDFLAEELFAPLEMESTGYRFRGDIRERLVRCYSRNNDGTLSSSEFGGEEHHEPDALYESGGSGLLGTLKDYLTFSQILANGGQHRGQRIIGRKTIDLMRQNQLDDTQIHDFQNSYLAGYGYGLGVRTLMSTAKGHSNGSLGEFGWTGALGTYLSVDPSEGLSMVYMHQLNPNLERYHHLRVRAVVNGCL